MSGKSSNMVNQAGNTTSKVVNILKEGLNRKKRKSVKYNTFGLDPSHPAKVLKSQIYFFNTEHNIISQHICMI